MLIDKINAQIIDALKANEKVKLETLRLLSSALKYAQIAKMAELTPEEELSVIRKEAKKRTETIEIYEKAGEQLRAEKEKAELQVLQEYLPKALSQEEVEKAVQEVISSGKTNFGDVMKEVMVRLGPSANGKVVSEIVKFKLTSVRET